jgi:hypothetical protein
MRGQEEVAAAREAAEAAAAWWRTRETKADATLRQQAKLIDFLQVPSRLPLHLYNFKFYCYVINLLFH